MKCYICRNLTKIEDCDRVLCWKCTQIMSGLLGYTMEKIISNCWNNEQKLNEKKLSALHKIYGQVFINDTIS